MMFDLPTLLAVWLGIDLLVGLAFWAQHRRLPHAGGLAWWALAALTHACAAMAMGSRPLLPEWLGLPLSNLLFTLTFALLWVGLRSYLELSVRRVLRGVGVLLLVLFPVNVFFILVVDSLLARQLLWVGSNVTLLLLMLGDARTHRAWPVPAEFRALTAVLWLQMALLLGYLLGSLWGGWSFTQGVSLLTFCFLLAYLLLALCFQCLLIRRLRDEAQAARAAQRRRESDLQRLVDNLDAGVMVFEPDQTLWRMNTAARRFLSWGGQEPHAPEASYNTWRMLDESGRPLGRHERPFERVLATAQPVRDVVVGLPIDGGTRLRWALCSGYPENDSQGALRRVVLTFIDITAMKAAQAEQKALETRLAQSQKMQALGTLAGGVAHDFNNILTAILGNAELAGQDLGECQAARESLNEIGTAARRGRELVRQILAFSRQQPMARAPLSLAEVVLESCALLRAALPPPVRLVQTIAPDLPAVSGDATQLQQVLVNLGTNALHALPARGGVIDIALDSVPLPLPLPVPPPAIVQACSATGLPALRLRVSDDGCGMDESVQRRIFEPFFTTKPVGQGTGLGLAVVLGIAESHGGHVEVCSSPQLGTTISLWLPPLLPLSALPVPPDPTGIPEDKPVTMTAVDTPLPPANQADALSDPAPHILYLDDDDTLVFLVRRLLTRRGYRVTAVSVQQEALAALREQPGEFALLLTDYNMPGMSGLEVAREALSIEPGLPVAVASGYITDELQAEARSAGVREVVFKTDAVEQFCEIVARLVRPAER